MCGPSPQQTAEAASQEAFAQTLQANYNTNFANNEAILGHLTNVLTPIAEAGPNQQGFSAGEKATLNTNAIDTTGANYNNAARAVQGQLSGRGTPGGPQSGVDQQINASIASQAAGQASTEENQIEQADYATGRANFNNAVSGLGGVAAQYNPNGSASVANSGASAAYSEAEQDAMQSEQQITGYINAGSNAVKAAGSAMEGYAQL
jgi:hypothetical protein